MVTKTELNKAASYLGRLGGRSTAKKRGKSFFSEIGKKGMESRWGKKSPDKK